VRLGGHVHLGWTLLDAFTVAALAGNRVASRVDAARLTTAFTVLLIALAAYATPVPECARAGVSGLADPRWGMTAPEAGQARDAAPRPGPEVRERA